MFIPIFCIFSSLISVQSVPVQDQEIIPNYVPAKKQARIKKPLTEQDMARVIASMPMFGKKVRTPQEEADLQERNKIKSDADLAELKIAKKLLQEGRLAEARSQFENCIHNDHAGKLEAIQSIIQIALLQNNYPEAIRLLKRFIYEPLQEKSSFQRPPLEIRGDAYGLLALLLFQQGQQQEASLHIRNGIPTVGRETFSAHTGLIYNGPDPIIIPFPEEIMDDIPTSAYVLMSLAQLQRNEFEEALANIRSVRQRQPDWIPGTLLEASFLQLFGRAGEARKLVAPLRSVRDPKMLKRIEAFL